MNVINVTEFRNNIGTYIDRLIYNNEEFLLKKGNKVVAKISNYVPSLKAKKEISIRDLAGAWKNHKKKIDRMYRLLEEADKKDLEKLKKQFR